MGFFRNKSGSIVPIAVLLIAVIIPITGLAVDISYYGILRSSVEKATEAAAVAGAQEYFRSKADAGKAVDATLRVFKMNISNETRVRRYHNPTGKGNPTTLTYSKTFTTEDGLSNLYRGSPISVTIKTDANRGKITVTSKITPNPFIAKQFADNATISITKEAELPPYDVVFVNDLSGSMKFATIKTYIGTAQVRRRGERVFMIYPDVIIHQSRNYPPLSLITPDAELRSIRVTDIIINSPDVDIPPDATFSNGRRIYTYHPKRGYIVSAENTGGLRRTILTGYRISELNNLAISPQDKALAQSYNDLRNLIDPSRFENYFNRAANYVEPHASALYGISTFIDTVRTYGAAALKLALVTFSSQSYTNDRIYDQMNDDIQAYGVYRRMRDTFPYVNLVNPPEFRKIVDKLTIMSSGGNGTFAAPLRINSYPTGGTNINAGLDNAKRTLDRSDRPYSEKIIILFTDGEPTSHSFSALGQKVKSLTDQGIKVYSVILTLSISQTTINRFKYEVEEVGKAEPVIFISDPAKLDEAFKQIADELGLKLTR